MFWACRADAKWTNESTRLIYAQFTCYHWFVLSRPQSSDGSLFVPGFSSSWQKCLRVMVSQINRVFSGKATMSSLWWSAVKAAIWVFNPHWGFFLPSRPVGKYSSLCLKVFWDWEQNMSLIPWIDKNCTTRNSQACFDEIRCRLYNTAPVLWPLMDLMN